MFEKLENNTHEVVKKKEKTFTEGVENSKEHIEMENFNPLKSW